MDDMVFASTLIYYDTHRQTHTEHSRTDILAHTWAQETSKKLICMRKIICFLYLWFKNFANITFYNKLCSEVTESAQKNDKNERKKKCSLHSLRGSLKSFEGRGVQKFRIIFKKIRELEAMIMQKFSIENIWSLKIMSNL